MGRYHQLFAEAERRHIPIEVSLELTHRCNFACRHCYVADLGAPGTVPTPRLLSLLEELADMGTLRVSLTGGEALLHPDWSQVARRARQLGFVLTLLSNGSLITEAVADELADLDAVVDVSLYAVDPAAFAEVTRRPGSLARTLDGIERLRARGVEVILKVPLLRPTAGGADAVFAYAERVGATCRAYPRVTTRTDGHRSPLALRLAHVELRHFYAGPHSSLVQPDQCHPPDGDGALCAAGSRFAAISPSGDVLACLDLPHPAGNILERPFREIWETSPWLRELRALRLRDLRDCGSCAKLAFCARCSADALHEDGDLRGPSRWSCEHAAAVEEIAREEAV